MYSRFDQGRLTPSSKRGVRRVVTWQGLKFAVSFAMLVLAIVSFNKKNRP